MPTCQTLIHAAYIITQDAERTVHTHASVAIDKGLIRALGPQQDMQSQWQAEQVLDLGNTLIMPGLINAHTHTAMTFLRGLADDLPLMDWLTKHIFPVEQHLTPEIVYYGTLLGHAEMLRTGTTACCDMYLIEEAVLHAAQASGIRCIGGEVVFTFPSAGSKNPQAALEKTRTLAAQYAHNPRIHITVCPHAVYTTTPELLIQCRDVAAELDIPLHLHLAETHAETSQCIELWEKRPIPYCYDLGLLHHKTILAHVVDANEADIELLAQSTARIVHNPSSNMKLASGVAPVPYMLQKNIAVALGTDGAACNNRLNMFTEMGRAALLHKVTESDPTLLPAQTVLDMATLHSAMAVHQPELGCLAVGHPADIIALDIREPNMQPMYNPVSHIVYAATGMEVCMTMIAGEVLYYHGKYTRFDYPALLEEIHTVRAWVQKHHTR